MITWTDLNNALGAIVSQTLTEIGLPAERDRQDITKPVTRRSYRIDLTATDGMGTDDYAETGVDVEIYFYPAKADRPRDEVQAAAQALRCALRPGIPVCGVVLEIADTIETDMTDGVLALMFRVDWVETAEETGEYMETLVLDQKEAE